MRSNEKRIVSAREMRGRKPTPTALRLLRGNPRKHPLNIAEPKPRALENPDPPAGLDRAAKREWRRVAPMLGRLGVLTESDQAALAVYCEAWATWKQATRKLRAGGLVVDSEQGPRPSPYVKIAHDAAVQMRTLLVEFGMTPSARARIKATKIETPASKWGGKL